MRAASIAIVLSTLGFLGSHALAQEQALEKQPVQPAKSPDEPVVLEERTEESRLVIALTPRFSHDFSAELKDSKAKSDVSRFNLNADLSAPINQQWRWNLNLNAEVSWYDWDDTDALISGGRDPIGNAYEITLTPGLAYGINQKWSIIGGGIVQSAFENGADLSESLTYGGYGGVQYTVGPNLSFTIGAAYKTRLENSGGLFPLLGLRWQITDKVVLAGEGPGARLSARINERVTFSVFGRYERREYRLDEDDDAAIPNGVARDTRVPVGVGLAWEPRPGFRIALEGGVVVYQEYIFDNEEGGRVAKDRTDPQPFVGLSGQITF